MRPQLLSASVLVVFLAGCGGFGGISDDSATEVWLGLASASLVGRDSALVLDSMAGTAHSCVTVTKACGATAAFPCQGQASVALGPNCALPLGGAAGGTVNVSGTWSSPTKATLTTEFVGVKAATSSEIAVASVKSISIERTGDLILIKYSGANAVARAGVTAAAVGASSSWDVEINTQGTADFTDDQLTIDSTSAVGGAGTAKVVTLKSAVVSPTCALNPTSGTGSLTEVSGLIPKILKFEFHAACDGKAIVNGSAQDISFFPR